MALVDGCLLVNHKRNPYPGYLYATYTLACTLAYFCVRAYCFGKVGAGYYIGRMLVRDGRGMGTPSPLHENRNPAPGKHNKPGSDWGVIVLIICHRLAIQNQQEQAKHLDPDVTLRLIL